MATDEHITDALNRLSTEPLAALSGTPWAQAAEAARWLLGGTKPAFDPRTLGQGEAASCTRRLMVRGALLDGDDLLVRALQAQLGESPEDTLLRMWSCSSLGEAVSPADLEALSGTARTLQSGALLVEVTALKALVSLADGQIEDALSLARRAARMARTEQEPLPSFFANAVLARARRLAGQPIRGAHILRTIRRYAPPLWHRWVDWESDLCEGTTADLHGWIARHPAWGHMSASDLTRVEQATSLHSMSAEPIASWSRGVVHPVPFGLSSFSDGSGHAALAVRPIEGLPQRVLGVLRGNLAARDFDVLVPRRRRQARGDRMIACLVLAGHSGLTNADLFTQAYGTQYVPDLHRGVLDVQLHRCRGGFSEHAQLVRADGRVTLNTKRPLAVVDPRCDRRGDERVLHLLGSHGRLSAQDTASELQISRRMAAIALKELAEEGFCTPLASARGRLVYTVEDTVFHPLTQAGAKPHEG